MRPRRTRVLGYALIVAYSRTPKAAATGSENLAQVNYSFAKFPRLGRLIWPSVRVEQSQICFPSKTLLASAEIALIRRLTVHTRAPETVLSRLVPVAPFLANEMKPANMRYGRVL